MSLPLYLNNIKHSGIYRFIFDKSEMTDLTVDGQMRLVVGYSEKGAFNTPVLCRTEQEFKTEFGGISKKLERYGCFFHRSALQCLRSGNPILALNIKPFAEESVKAVNFDVVGGLGDAIDVAVKELYNTDRFWYLEPERFEEIELQTNGDNKYITISTTDGKESASNTIFMRGYQPKNYDLTFQEYFASMGLEMPSYLEGYETEKVCNYFAELYIFKGQFTKDIVTSEVLSKYFKVEGDQVVLRDDLKNAFGETIDTLSALANNECSNFIRSYNGILLPEFIGSNGSVISLDALVNADHSLHKMLMRLDQTKMYDGDVDVRSLMTTGWNVADGQPIMSITSVTKDVCTVVYNADKKEWVYTGNEDATLYKYDTDECEINGATVTCYMSYSNLNINVGDSFIGKDGIVTVLTKEMGVDSEGDEAIVYTMSGEVTEFTKCMNPATTGCKNLVPMYLEGYTYTSSKPASTKQNDKLLWQKNILNVLTEKGIRQALTNRVDSDYRYLIDTFESFVESDCKAILAGICKEKFNCLGLLNMPAMKSFSNCEYTSFRDAEGRFNVSYIAKGGNPQKIITRPFTLVSEEGGASFVEYVTMLSVRDTVTGVKTNIPSAALLSNEYMRKYNERFPYSIVAGPKYGRVTENGLIGPDFNFGSEDLDVLEPMGVNCFVYTPNMGTHINSQQTAKQTPVTALSKVHVRELCTFLQDEIENMLKNYQWEFNTQRLRDEVKGKADVICETCKNNGGINAYVNICDATNNTNEVIEREFFILSTEIEPGYGAGKMVQTLTIRNNGTLSATIVEQ